MSFITEGKKKYQGWRAAQDARKPPPPPPDVELVGHGDSEHGPIPLPGRAPPPTPAAKPPMPKVPGLLDKPGTGENWFSNNAGKFGQGPGQRQLGDYWQGIQGNFNKQIQPDASRQAWASYGGQMGQAGQGTQNARDTSWRLSSTPGYGEHVGQEVGDYFRTQGAGEQNAYGMLDKFNQAGVAEGNYGNAKSALAKINYGDRSIGDISNRINTRSGNTLAYNKDFNSSGFMNQSPVSDEYGYFSQGLRDPSYSEQMYESGNGGLIDPYARAQEKQTKKLRDASAARGFFGSGAGLRAEQELGADIAAQEAHDRVALAQQADSQRLARTGEARNFASAIDQSQLGRRELGLRSASTADESERANSGQLLNAYQLASNEALQKVGLETSASDVAQRSAIDRMFRGGELGLSADKQGSERAMNRMSAAERAQNLERQRNVDSADIGLRADQEDRTRQNDYFRNAGDMDRREMDFYNDYTNRLKQGGEFIKQIDDDRRQDMRQDMLDEQEAAYKNQNAFEGRERNALSDISGVQSQMADMVFRGLDTATRERLQLQLDEIEGQLHEGKLNADAAAQKTQDLFSAAGLGVKAYELYLKSKGK